MMWHRLVYKVVRRSTIRKTVISIALLMIVFMGGCSGRHDGLLSEKFQYDNQGRLTLKVARDGGKTKYQYNKQGLPSTIKYPNDTVKYGYDPNGNRIWMSNKSGRTEYQYDPFDRLIEVVFKYSPERKIKYAYDPWGRLKSITLPNGYQVAYEYDLFDRMTRVDDGHVTVRYEYQSDANRVVRRLSNGISTIFEYSDSAQLLLIHHQHNDASLIAAYRYEYDPDGRISTVEETTPQGTVTTQYTFDLLGRLIKSTPSNGSTVSYAYDVMGNRTSQTNADGTISYLYDSKGRLMKTGDISLSYDASGNLISKKNGKQSATYQYNEENRLIKVQTNGTTIHYTYDGDGNRTSREVQGKVTRYLQHFLTPLPQVAAEYDESGKQHHYLLGHSRIARRDANGQMVYFLEDYLGSTRYAVDSVGNLLARYTYSSFGFPTLIEGSPQTDFLYTGEQWDPEAKILYLRARYYDPQIGRFLSPDPLMGVISDPQSFNRYLYASNDPVNRVDPAGMESSFWDDLNRGIPFGTVYGQKATDYWAQKEVETGNCLYRVLGCIAATWTPGTWQKTTLTLAAPPIFKAFTAPNSYFLIKGLKAGSRGEPFHLKLLGRVVHYGVSVKHGPHIGIGISAKAFLHLTPTHINIGGAKGIDIPNIVVPVLWQNGTELFSQLGEAFSPGLNDLFQSVETKLGGIKLDSTAQFTGNIGDITGVVYDPEKQVLILVGDENRSLSSIKPEDMAIALISVFGPNPQDPQFTLDPADPQNPRGKWLKAVYIPEEIIGGTAFGQTLFEADWLLKQYSFGVKINENGKVEERKSSVHGLKSIAELSLENKEEKDRKESWNRFWIVSDKMELKKSGKSLYFDAAKMGVRSRKIVPDKSSPQGFRDVDTEDDPIASKFASSFTELYDQIAKESPEFERVRQLAKAVAIAKWIKQEGIPIDINWVNEYANKRIRTTDRVTALSTESTLSTQRTIHEGDRTGILTEIQRIRLFGGVDLTVTPEYKSDDGHAQGLQKAVTKKLQEKLVDPIFKIQQGEKMLTGVIFPVTKNGQKMWEDAPIITADGTKYQLNKQGQAIQSVDKWGNSAEYIWGADHRLNQFNVAAKNGWFIEGRRENGASEITVTNLRKNKFTYRYNASGALSDIIVDQKKYAGINYKEGGMEIDYGNYMERFTPDRSGHIQQYEVQPYRKGTPYGKPQVLNISYDKSGDITNIHSQDAGHLKFDYLDGRLKTMGTPRGQVDYTYETENDRVAQMKTTWGESIEYDYAADHLERVLYRNKDYARTVMFQNGLPVSEKDTRGKSEKYAYTQTGFLKRVEDSTGAVANYSYNNQDRIETIGFPNRSSIHFKYKSQRSKNPKEAFLKEVMVTYNEPKALPSPEVLKASRIEDIEEAGKTLKNGFILDLLVGGDGSVDLNIADRSGKISHLNEETSKEFRKLMEDSTASGSSERLTGDWDKFYDKNLSHLTNQKTSTSFSDSGIKRKPVLIIKSNMVNYKYDNLEKVKALRDNFIIFIASDGQHGKSTSEKSAKELARKIKNIPKIKRDNTVFIIRLPDEVANSPIRREWDIEVDKLRDIVGKENVLFDPSKDEFSKILEKRGKDIIAIEMTHTDKGIVFGNGEEYTSRDIKMGQDLSHIKYLLSGLGTCRLCGLEEGGFVSSLKGKGLGIVNGTYRLVSSDVALKRLRELNNLFKDIERHDLYPYHLLDVIDQRLNTLDKDKGTINLGKRENHDIMANG